MSSRALSVVRPLGTALLAAVLAGALVGWVAMAVDEGPVLENPRGVGPARQTCASCPPGTVRLKLTGPTLKTTLGVPAVDGARLRAPSSAAAIVIKASPTDGGVRVTIFDEREPLQTRLEFDLTSTSRREIRTRDLGVDLLPDASGPIVVSLPE